jgi:ABC-2 type transport system permease protein
MSMGTQAGRLSLWHAAFVIARRDFTAILFSRAFIFFLLGPLFPLGVAALAGGIGAQIQSEALAADVGIAMQAADTDAFMQARDELAAQVGPAIPPIVVLERLEPGEIFDAQEVLEGGEGRIAAVVTGTLAQPELTAPQGNLARWSGTIALIAATAQRSESATYPQVVTHPVATSGASENRGRYQTAQGGQILLFLLIMLLASMVLSNLVEEKGNKIIEILAAAVPMNAVFMGKLFAMLGISIFGIMVWGSIGTGLLALGERSLSEFANPGVGWPMFFALGAIYFAMGYLLLGSIFLTIGSMAPTVRDVQTMAMPVTMAQVVVFFLANMAVTQMGTWIEYAAIVFPLSSPFVMVARGAMDEALWPHLLAIAWQIVCVVIFVRVGSSLFRRKVMKSGPQAARRKGLLRRILKTGADLPLT